MRWNPFGKINKPPKPEVKPQIDPYTEQCVAEAKAAGFDLDFEFRPDDRFETLVHELNEISVNTFWADNPIEGKVEEEERNPAAREEYKELKSRGSAILAEHASDLRVYLAPYKESAETWINKVPLRLDIRGLDRALDYWTRTRGMAHRNRFWVAVKLFR